MKSLVLVVSFIFAATSLVDASIGEIQYSGPIAFPIGTNATFACVFDANASLAYEGIWQIADNEDRPTTRLAKVAEDDSFMYNNAPDFIKDRFAFDASTLSEGRLVGIIKDVQVGDDREFRCIIEQERFSENHDFDLKVYSMPTVYVYDEQVEFSAYPDVNTDNATDTSDNSTTTVATDFEEEEPADPVVASCGVLNVYPKPRSLKFVEKSNPDKTVVIDSEEWTVETNADSTLNIFAQLAIPVGLPDHTNVYDCVVELDVDFGDDSGIVTSENSTSAIVVNHPTTLLDFSITPAVVQRGEQVTFRCEADGYPMDPQLQIIKVGATTPLKVGARFETVLTLTVTAHHDMDGQYRCSVNGQRNDQDLTVNWHDSSVKMKVRANGVTHDLYPGENSGIEVPEGKKIDITCEQEGKPRPELTFVRPEDAGIVQDKSLPIGFKAVKKLTIKDAPVSNTGRYICASSYDNIATSIDITITSPCTISLITAVSQDASGDKNLRVVCQAPEGSPSCTVDMDPGNADILPAGKRTYIDGKLMYDFVLKETLKAAPTFSCTVFNSVSRVHKNVTVTAEDLLQEAQKSAGMSPGIVVVIILLATLVIIGIPYAYYKCRRQSSDDGSHIKGNQLDSVEAEKLEAVEQGEEED